MSKQAMTCPTLCSLFCCPPLPSRIVAKLAFLPPPTNYTLATDAVTNKHIMQPTEGSEWQCTPKELESVDVMLTDTSRRQRIVCMFVRCCPDARYTLMYSHGNAVDLWQMIGFYFALGTRLNCNVFGYDYSGYGASTGRPSEKNLYSDAEAAWQVLRISLGVPAERIVLYGQSIGTVPTVDLAARYKVAAVVLHSPLTSGIRFACPRTNRTWCCDPFPSIDKVPKINSVVLIIHGSHDEVVHVSHGEALYERCPHRVDPLWVDGAGHNDIELFPQYWDRLKQFMATEIEASADIDQMSVTVENDVDPFRSPRQLEVEDV